jgi:hypothetical protein
MPLKQTCSYFEMSPMFALFCIAATVTAGNPGKIMQCCKMSSQRDQRGKMPRDPQRHVLPEGSQKSVRKWFPMPIVFSR